MKSFRRVVSFVLIVMFMGGNLLAQRGRGLAPVGEPSDTHGVKSLNFQLRQGRKYELLRNFHNRRDKSVDFDSFVKSQSIAEWKIPPGERSYEACLEGARWHITNELKRYNGWIRERAFERAKNRRWTENLKDLSEELSRHLKDGMKILEMCKAAGLDFRELHDASLMDKHRADSSAMLGHIKNSGETGDDLLFSIGTFLLCPHPQKDLADLLEWLENNHDQATMRMALLYISKDAIATGLLEKYAQANGGRATALQNITDAASFTAYLESNPTERELDILFADLLGRAPRWLYELGLNGDLPLRLREGIVEKMLYHREWQFYPKYLALLPGGDNDKLKRIMLDQFGDRVPVDFDHLFELARRNTESPAIRGKAIKILTANMARERERIFDDDWMASAEEIGQYNSRMASLAKTLEKFAVAADEPESVKSPSRESLEAMGNLRQEGEHTLTGRRKSELGRAREMAKETVETFRKADVKSKALSEEQKAEFQAMKSAMLFGREINVAEAELKLFHAEIIEIARQDNGKLPQKLEGLKLSFDLYKRPLYFPTEKVEQLSETIVIAAYPKKFVQQMNDDERINDIMILDGRGEFEIVSDEEKLKRTLGEDAEQRKELGLHPINYDALFKLFEK